MANADNRMLELAAGWQDYKTQSLSIKCQKYLSEADKARYAAEEHVMATCEWMMKEDHGHQREKEEHEIQMMRLQIELVQAQNAIRSSTGHSGNQAFGLNIQQPMGLLGETFGTGSTGFSHPKIMGCDSNNKFWCFRK